MSPRSRDEALPSAAKPPVAATLPIEELCGQLIVGGFEGHSPPTAMLSALASGLRAGVILFSRNIESIQGAHACCLEIADLGLSPSPFVSVDQEGGRVARLRAPVVKLPPMRRLGELDDTSLAHRAGATLGRELLALGFNVDFAPVLDVDSNPANPVIGDRSFGSDPALVARLGGAFAAGLEAAGVMACGKHFPGHGDTSVDSHLDLPAVSHPEARLREVELAPFSALAKSVSSLMSAHVVFDALDAELPATLSRRIATELLREELGFRGLLFSDDLEMRALADRRQVESSAVEAIRAGCDVLLICRSFEWQERAHAALVAEARSDERFLARCREAAGRCLDARARFPLRPARSPGDLEASLGTSDAQRLLEALEPPGG